MQRRISVWMVMVMMLAMMLVSCTTTVKEQWDKLTPQQQAAVIADGIQDQIDSLLTQGIAYVKANPQHTAKWAKEILPAIKIANSANAEVITLAKAGQIVPAEVYTRMTPLINAVVNYLIGIGAIKKSEVEMPLRFPVSQNAAMDIAMAMLLLNMMLSTVFNIWDKVYKVSGGTIPTWEELTNKNRVTALKIEEEEARVDALLTSNDKPIE